MSDEKKCCGECVMWTPYSDRSSINPIGECGWRPSTAIAKSYDLTMMFPEEGTDCPCFERKEQK